MSEQTQALPFIDGLYAKLVEGGVGYFFPSAKFESLHQWSANNPESIEQLAGNSLILNWLGSRYSLTSVEAFSDAELKLLESIRAVLDSRYRMISDPTLVEQRFELFKGLPEDRYVSAFIDRAPYAKKTWQGPIELRMQSKFSAPVRSVRTRIAEFQREPCFSGNIAMYVTMHRSPPAELFDTTQT